MKEWHWIEARDLRLGNTVACNGDIHEVTSFRIEGSQVKAGLGNGGILVADVDADVEVYR